jgi:hypothetical protein
MPYTAPTRDVIRTAVSRDLRDPDGETFTVDELNDLLNLAIVEVGRIYPKQQVEELTIDADGQSVFPTEAYALFRVEVLQEGQTPSGIPLNGLDASGEGGWDLHAGALYLPQFAARSLSADTHSLRIWGYWPRELFSEDTDVLDGDADTEFAVRTVATLNGYQRLQNDRLLFQQWLTNTGNSDVSPNQLAQTADMYQSQWREMRNRLRTLQRV